MSETDVDDLDAAEEELTAEHLVASPDRRFYAFVLDRLLAWGLFAVAAYAAYHFLIAPGHLWAGVAAIAGAVLLVSLLFALGVGMAGVTPGKAAIGLRVLSAEDARPIGIKRSLLRSLIVGVMTLPTIGFGAGSLAWTAMMDVSGWRRGWHDLRAGSVVVDVRPLPVVEEAAEEAPRQVVNLTALRLVPASPTPPRRNPSRAPRPPIPPQLPEPVLSPTAPSAPTPTVSPRQGLGWPLIGDAPTPAPEAPTASVQPSPATAPTGPPPAAPPGAPTSPPPAAPPAAPPTAPPTGAQATRPPHRAQSPAATWLVSFDTGESFEVRGLTLVGRRPEPRQGEPVKRLVSLPSDDMSLSKTHAQFQVVPDGALVVMDRGSTNGSILVRAGVTKRLAGGKPATLRDGDRVRFGDREMTVARQG